jgi:glycosyltransferase involved in cell wall biosynthesis
VESARRLGKPVAVSPFAHPGDWGFDSGSIRAYRTADVVIATCAADAAIYRGAGVGADRLEAVGLPVPGLATPSADAALPGVPADAPLVTFVGARKPTKGVDLLLAAATIVWQRQPNTRFAFVGPGDPLLADDERVIEVGRVSDEERAPWVARAALLCLPSSGESFGLVVPEAWSVATPVVVSDIPVLQELATESGGGVVAARDPESLAGAISSLLDDPQRARSLGQAGHDYWASHLTPASVTRKHLAIYRRIGA